MNKTLALVREFRKGDDETPIVLMGYYNPIYIYGVDRFLADAKAAGVDGLIVVDLPPEEDDELCLPALKAGPQFHPPGDADHRRQAPAGGAQQYLRLRLLRLDHRHHRRRRARCRQGRRGGRAHQAPHQAAGRGRLRRAHRRAGARHRRKAPTAWWSARRWSTRCGRASTRTAKPAPAPSRRSTDLVSALAQGVRSGPPRARRYEQLAAPAVIISAKSVPIEASHELDLQRRPAENSQLPAPRDAGKSLDQMSGDRPARLLQGRRGQPVRHSRAPTITCASARRSG